MRVLVTGGAGGLGGALVAAFRARGDEVLAADIVDGADLELDVRSDDDWAAAREAVAGTDDVYNLAADMGGMGFIESHKAACMLSVLVSTHLLVASRDAGIGRCLVQFARRADGYDFSMVHDGHTVAKFFRFLDVMGGDQNGFLFFFQFFNNIVNFAAYLRI